MQEKHATWFVSACSILIVAACVGWAAFVQTAVPDACSYSTPPADAQILHC